jgi:hypothetical protein
MQRFLLIIAWMLVLTPLSWGVARSVQRSLPLFSAGSLINGSQPAHPSNAGAATPNKP